MMGEGGMVDLHRTWSSLQSSLARVVFPEPPIPQIPTIQSASLLEKTISITFFFPKSNPTLKPLFPLHPSTHVSSSCMLFTASSTHPPPFTPIFISSRNRSIRRFDASTRSNRSAISNRAWCTSASMCACMGTCRNLVTCFSSFSIFFASWKFRYTFQRLDDSAWCESSTPERRISERRSSCDCLGAGSSTPEYFISSMVGRISRT